MPELAEVEIIKNNLSPILNNKIIKKINIYSKKLRYSLNIKDILSSQNKIITDVKRRGKYLIWILNNKACLSIHFGMGGSLVVNPKQKTIYDHVSFTLSSEIILIYKDIRKFGMIEYHLNIQDFIINKKLGVEPLSHKITLQYFMTHMKKHKCSIKSLLMNQKFIAGIGNIYANEILFLSEVFPLKKSYTLNKIEIKKILYSIKQILNQAIKYGGSTIKDYTNIYAKSGKFQNKFKVYNRENKDCIRCLQLLKKTKIIKIIHNQRSTFYCNKCQV